MRTKMLVSFVVLLVLVIVVGSAEASPKLPSQGFSNKETRESRKVPLVGTLTVKIDKSSPPSQLLLANTPNQQVAIFEWCADRVENFSIYGFVFRTKRNYKAIERYHFETDRTRFASSKQGEYGGFLLEQPIVQKAGTCREIVVTVDTARIDGREIRNGDIFWFEEVTILAMGRLGLFIETFPNLKTAKQVIRESRG